MLSKNLFIMLGICISLVFAHPHVFVDADVQVLFNERGFSGIKNHWVYDEFYSAAMIASVDENSDGNLSPEEVSVLKPAIMNDITRMNYFNYVQSGADFLKAESIKKFNASIKNRRLVLDFVVDFFVPVTDDYSMLVVVVADPTNYVQVTTDMEKADVQAPESIDVEYFSDGLEGLSLFRAFMSDIEGLYLRFMKK